MGRGVEKKPIYLQVFVIAIDKEASAKVFLVDLDIFLIFEMPKWLNTQLSSASLATEQ